MDWRGWTTGCTQTIILEKKLSFPSEFCFGSDNIEDATKWYCQLSVMSYDGKLCFGALEMAPQTKKCSFWRWQAPVTIFLRLRPTSAVMKLAASAATQ